MRRMTRILLLSWILAALTGCTLSFSGPEVAELPEFSGVPVVRITAPLPNATYLSGVSVNVQVQVAAAGPDIDRVEVFADDALIGTLPQPNPTGAAAFGVTQTFTAEGEGQHTIRALAYREDGSVSDPVTVTINVVHELPSRATATAEPTDTSPAVSPTSTVLATATVATVATNTPETASSASTPQATVGISINPTSAGTPSAASTSAPSGTAPIAKFEGVVNVRRGPSTNFEPPLGTFQAGQQTEILSQNNDGTWFKVKFANGEGWVFAQITKTEGDIASLPREAGPPIPTARPATATPIAPVVQPTSAPSEPTTAPVTSDGPNLVVVNWEMRVIEGNRPVNDIAVNQPAIAFVRVRNAGNQPASGFFAVLTIVNSSDSGAKIVEAGSSVGLAPGEEQVIQVGFNDNTAAAGTGRVAVVRLDENNQVPETNENDNASSPISYTLAG
jgi:uncharacterized protein YraI